MDLPTDSRSGSIVAANVFGQVLSTVFFGARVYSRLYLQRIWRSEDWLLLTSWVLSTVTTAIYLSLTRLGLGDHIWTVPITNLTAIELRVFWSNLTFAFALGTSKLSICMVYWHVFRKYRTSRYAVTAIIILVILITIPMPFLLIFQCHPVSAFWASPLNRSPTACMDARPIFLFNGATSAFTETALILVTFPQVLALHLALSSRIALLTVVSLGWLTVIASVIRMVTSASLFKAQSDPTYQYATLHIWTAVEIHVSVFCAAAPCLNPLLVRIMPRWFADDTASTIRSVGDPSVRKEIGTEDHKAKSDTS